MTESTNRSELQHLILFRKPINATTVSSEHFNGRAEEEFQSRSQNLSKDMQSPKPLRIDWFGMVDVYYPDDSQRLVRRAMESALRPLQ